MKFQTSRSGVVVMALLSCLLLLAGASWAQSTNASGSIQGTVSDQSGAVVSNATVTITSDATGQKITKMSTDSGTFTSGPLNPGQYTVRIERKGFQSVSMPITVQVGSNVAVNPKLAVGAESQTVEVTGQSLAVNTEQAAVQGVLTSQQIENLPVNGRNFLDLAQIEPGVQIQDGGNFDPTKNGYSSVSFGGRSGRTARITVDGIDISDENVGTTTQNVSAGAISEFQLSQSSLDLSTELTSSGAVNVVTKSGTNSYHGDGFYLFRDKRAGFANFPAGYDTPFQRNHFGGSIGGPVVKNNLFFFANAERVKQDQLVPVIPLSQFTGAPAGYGAPFRDTTMLGRLDWNAPHGVRVFYKFSYNYNGTTRSDIQDYQPFINKNNVPSHGIGVDFTTGGFTHSIRYGYVYFTNQIADAVVNNPGIYDPLRAFGIAGRVGPLGTPMRFGPNRLAPQESLQKNQQLKYDGSHLWGKHLFRYGVDFNHIALGGLASFYQYPEIRASNSAASQAVAAAGPYPGGAGNALNYVVNASIIGNGVGFNSERPAFGFAGGGFTPKRLGLYFGDSWKFRPNLTITAGLRYQREYDRAATDIAPIPCSSIDTTAFSSVPCTGNAQLLDQWGAGRGDRIQQPNQNWGPQLGFAWDPHNNGKTVVRGGIGVYYENTVLNNVLFDRAYRLQGGLFNNVQAICGANGNSLTIPGVGNVDHFTVGGTTYDIGTQLCGLPFGQAAPVAKLLGDYVAAQTIAAGPQGNGNFVGNTLGTFAGVIDPHFKTPFSIQMNIGFQREIRTGMVLSADFLRNVGERFLMPVEANHVGDVRFFDKTAATNAINATLAACGVATIDAAIASCPGLHAGGGGATIADFARKGLDSGTQRFSGYPASAFGVDAAHGAAFPGMNPGVGTGVFLMSTGRSTYTALQLKLQQRVNNPMRGIGEANFQVSYSLSRFNNSIGADQDYGTGNLPLDNANPSRYYGPSSLDRTNQLSWGGSFQVKHGPQLSFIGHVFSPLAITPLVQTDPGGARGEIFRSDFTGDGTVGDVLPGANVGTVGRDVNGAGINSLINAYNSNVAGKLTPAGQTLVSNGLFTQAQLVALNAVAQPIQLAPNDQLKMSWLKTVDMRFEWPISISERIKLHPSVGVFNLFNFANYNPNRAQLMTAVLDGSSPSINGSPKSDPSSVDPLRANVGTGVNSFAAPRQMEFGLRLVF
ncbi:MAG TPA: carboxypeptidase regulatory-like domain-containing protein [Terriglobales bacterium]|nr:carboxypeptidase regulatory-like domain-containing protein [Terriglobales bacterium]